MRRCVLEILPGRRRGIRTLRGRTSSRPARRRDRRRQGFHQRRQASAERARKDPPTIKGIGSTESGSRNSCRVLPRVSNPGQQTQDQQAEDAQAEPAPSAYPGNGAESEQNVAPDSKSAANGRRDPFISPVVSHAGGSGCSTGKKCLEIGAINLRGVVRAESGFIAVVSNGMNKAYFLRENDPVFNGYVVKITGDSIVFQETLQDRLGKTFTREVVKKITTPAV